MADLDPQLNPRLLYLDRDAEHAAGFLSVLQQVARVETHPTLESLLRAAAEEKPELYLLDVDTLQHSPTSHMEELLFQRRTMPMGLASTGSIDSCLSDLRRWGILQVCVKDADAQPKELAAFVDCIIRPEDGFGLIRYMTHTVNLYSVSIATLPQKNDAIERALNHFATCGFDVHELYDVRLTLEELANNALFHAFRTETGAEKYTIRHFKGLEPGETVRMEYGSDGETTGFSVTDNAGSLSIKTILMKIERQLNREGLYDDSGRGLYLTRMLSSQMVFNLEKGKRTQLVVLFDERRKQNKPKPFLINYVGPDTFTEWGVDPDFD